MISIPLIRLLLCVGLIAPVSSAIAQSDQLFTSTGATVNGQVVATTPIQVTMEVQGNKRVVKVNQIRRLAFGGEPTAMNTGRARILAGKIESGYNELQRVDPASIKRDIVRRDLQFYLAYCEGRLALSIGGDKAKATQSMLAFVRAAPQSQHFFEAAELLGDLAVSRQDYASAVRYYGSISSRAPFVDYKMRALISEARAFVQQGQFADAQAKFEEVLGIESGTAEARRQKRFAEIGVARCLAETASPEEALRRIEKIIADNDAADGELFGRAYNAQGDCYRKAGKKKEALMAYLHVDVLFYADPDVHAEALYRLVKLWSTLNNPDRANAAKGVLDGRYAGSVWSGRDE